MLSTSGNERRIGFFSNPQNKIDLKKQDAALLDFGDAQVSFADAGHNVLVVGTTGIGKTSSVIVPAIDALISAGFSGLIVDIKGNLSDYVRAVAKATGHEKRLVEYGTGPQATKVNILNGLSRDRCYQIMKNLFVFSTASRSDHNVAWHLKGLQCVTDAMQFSQILARRLSLRWNLELLERIINDPLFASKLYTKFKDHFFNCEDYNDRDLVTRIDSDYFHILKEFEAVHCKSDLEERKPDEILNNSSWLEQTTWRLSIIRNGLQVLKRVRGIENFFANVDRALNIEKLIYNDHKIIILRLHGATGEIGKAISRLIVEDYYQAVFDRGLSLPDDQYTFLVADEAQEFISVDPDNIYNDNSFIARAREFHNINILGTQSVAALEAKTRDKHSVAAMLGNFNVRIFLHSDDPRTSALIDPYTAMPLTDIKKGEAFLIKFDTESRQHQFGKINVQTLHDRTKELIMPYFCKTSPMPVALSQAKKFKNEQKQRELEESYIKDIPIVEIPATNEQIVVCPVCNFILRISLDQSYNRPFRDAENVVEVHCQHCNCRFFVEGVKPEERPFGEPDFNEIQWRRQYPLKNGIYLWRSTTTSAAGICTIINGQNRFFPKAPSSIIEFSGPINFESGHKSKKSKFIPGELDINF